MRTFWAHFDHPFTAGQARMGALAVLSFYAKLNYPQGELPMSTAATQTSHFMTWLPLAAMVLAITVLIFWRRQNRRINSVRLTELDGALAVIRDQVLLVSTETVPQNQIVKTIGLLESMSEIEASSDGDYRLAEKEALLGLGRQAFSAGANAIVGVRKLNAHYDQAGSQWRVSRVTYLGTAVVVKSQS